MLLQQSIFSLRKSVFNVLSITTAFRQLQYLIPFSMAKKSQYDVSRCAIRLETNRYTVTRVCTGVSTLL